MMYRMHLMMNHSIAQAGAEQILEKITEKIKSAGGKVTKKKLGDLIRLETPIKKSETARYAYLTFELNGDKLKDLNYELKVTEGLDRQIILADQDNEHDQAKFEVLSEKDYRRRGLDFWKSNLIMEQPSILKFFLTPRGRILPRRLVFNFIGHDCHAIMRQLAQAVKQARFMGWLRLK